MRIDKVTGEPKWSFAWALLVTFALWGLVGLTFYTIGSMLRGAML